MKICFVVPDLPILEKIQILMKNEFKRIEPYYLIYNDYKEVYKDLDKIQKNFDAVLFGGKLPYLYCAEKIKQEVMWSYVPRTGSTLVTALAYLSRHGYDLKRICFDTYSEEVLKEVYEELNIAHDFKPLLFKGDPLNDNYIDEVFDFHLRNIKSGKADIVFTHIFLVHNKILQLQLPSFFAVTTYNVLRDNSVGEKFKKEAKNFCAYKGYAYLKNETNWKHLVQQNVHKANMLTRDTLSWPESKDDVRQELIFDAQIMKYVLPHNKVAILNAFPMFLYYYFPLERFQPE